MRKLCLLLFVATAACAVYPEERDTTQPNKLKKSWLVCEDPEAAWETCANKPAQKWIFRPTVISAPYEAWWTFVGEQGGTYKIRWEISEKHLTAFRTYEVYKGSEGDAAKDPNFKGEPIAQWNISSHFDVWYQYNGATGEQIPVLYEAQERPWYEREYMRVDWARNNIAGYGYFMGSKLTTELFGDVKVEPATYAVDNPNDPDYRILTADYMDVVSRETHTPMTVSGMDGAYFSGNPVSQVSYRYSFMRDKPRDYEPFYYPDPAFEKFGYFRLERETYDRERGVTDFRDLLMERWNLWEKVHSTQTCARHDDCAGAAENGVTCDLFSRDENDKGMCTLPYEKRGLKPITYYLSPGFPDRFVKQACAVAQGWNIALKTTHAELLGKSYEPPRLDEAFVENCKLSNFKPVSGDFDPAVDDLLVLKYPEKTCDSDGVAGRGDRWCQRIGDLRTSMIAWIDQPSSGSPLGYGPVASDPETGEIIQGNSFIYGAAIDSYKSYIGDVYDLITGEVTDEAFMSGENVRDYYQNVSGNVFPPTFPQNGFRVGDVDQLQSLKEHLRGMKDYAEQLNRLGPSARTPFKYKLAGTHLERMLFDNDEWKASNGIALDRLITEEELDAVSPFREGFWDRTQRFEKVQSIRSQSKNCIYEQNEYTDATVSWLAERYASQGLGREEALARLMESIFRGVTEHEMGHNMGLRHNFEASFDADNYFPEYYALLHDPDLRDPTPEEFGYVADDPDTPANEYRPLTPEEYQAYSQARREARRRRDAAGIKMHQYSSIMDYGGQFYSDFNGLGKYDLAAIKFGYGKLVEVFDGPPNVSRSNRLTVPWYLGGESCTTNAECPYSGRGQECVPATSGSQRRTCSSWDADAAQSAGEMPVVKYRFCSDERTADRPFCNRFDEGASSLEIVENLIESYDRNYLFNNFRRYRRYFGPSYGNRIWSRYFSMMGKQYASLLYQLYYNQNATLSSGPGSFSDMLSASVLAMNFFERVLATPDVGAYRKTPYEVVDGEQTYMYERYASDCKASGADLSACLGVGKHFYSVWEKGYYGALDRQARAGTFTDKIYALLALTNREWGNPQANDETYPLSFYDGFQGEMLNLFSGLISNDVGRYAPVVGQHPPNHPTQPNKKFVEYRDIWSGTFYNASADDFSYDSSPIVKYPESGPSRYKGRDLLNPEGSSPVIRFYALMLSLQSWPSVYDQTYADYLQLYTFGAPEVRYPADGVETVSYESPLRKKTYMAVQTPDQKSIIFPLVKKAAELKTHYEYYKGLQPSELDTAQFDDMKARYPRLCTQSRAPTAEACRARIVDKLTQELESSESFLNITDETRKLIGLAL